jgi:hypothetical protein
MATKKKTTTPTRKRGPRRLYVTEGALGRATNEEILAVFELIGDEVVRRIENYGENARTPVSLLDGIEFASEAQRIQMDFTHDPYPWGLYHAPRVLVESMGGPWQELDDRLGFDDDEESDDPRTSGG